MNACLKQTLEEREAHKDEVGEVSQGPCSVPLSLICLLRVSVYFWAPTMSGPHNLAPENNKNPQFSFRTTGQTDIFKMFS